MLFVSKRLFVHVEEPNSGLGRHEEELHANIFRDNAQQSASPKNIPNVDNEKRFYDGMHLLFCILLHHFFLFNCFNIFSVLFKEAVEL